MSPSTRLAAAAAFAFLPATALAQATPARVSGIPAGCDYATCALRIEQGWGNRIVRGAAGQRVGSVGGFGTGVDILLVGTDSSRAHAQRFQSASRVASTLGLAAAATWIYAVVRFNRNGEDDETAAIAGLAATGLTLVSIPFANRAQRGLSRSIWWYNAALPNAPQAR